MDDNGKIYSNYYEIVIEDLKEIQKVMQNMVNGLTKMNEDMIIWINEEVKRKNQGFKRCSEKVEFEYHDYKLITLQCELWENHAGAHFFNNFNISDDEC